jgi:hypothetical protein
VSIEKNEGTTALYMDDGLFDDLPFSFYSIRAKDAQNLDLRVNNLKKITNAKKKIHKSNWSWTSDIVFNCAYMTMNMN